MRPTEAINFKTGQLTIIAVPDLAIIGSSCKDISRANNNRQSLESLFEA